MPSDQQTQFRWFVTLWVMAFSFHYFENRPLEAWPLVLAGIPCFIAPSSLLAFGVFLTVATSLALLDLPAPANHLVVGLVINLALALSAIRTLQSRPPASSANVGFGSMWIENARTPVGLTLLVVYLFGTFHKLNTSFFDPQVSCAGTLLEQLIELQGFDVEAVPRTLVSINAALTIVCEGLILVALAVPKWWRWGVLIAVIFHAGLGWARFYDFASIALALFLLLLPRETFARVHRAQRWRVLAVAGWAVNAAISLIAYRSLSDVSPVGLTWHTLQAATWSLAIAPLLLPPLLLSFRRDAPRLTPPGWKLRPAWLLIPPALAFANGMTPYLGIKTVANYSMFSNLRTEEGQTNHVIPAVSALEVTDYLHDTVDIYELKLPDRITFSLVERAFGGYQRMRRHTRWLRDEELVRVPWIELRRAVLVWKDLGIGGIRIRYVRNGVARVVDDAISDEELTQPLPWWTRRFQAFRAIQIGDGPVSCRW